MADVVANSAARAPFIYCDLPINDGPRHWVAKAAIAAMNRWLSSGDAAPHAPLLALNHDGTDFEFDDLGNVKGGIRTPYVNAIDTATDAAVAGRFLVPADAQLIKARARTSGIGNP